MPFDTRRATKLLKRVEDGQQCEEHMLLMETFEVVRGPPRKIDDVDFLLHNNDARDFYRKLLVHAYESAALSLIREPRRMSVQQRRSYEPYWVSFMLDGGTEYDATGKAKTLGLAIAAAALRLHCNMEETS